LAKNSVTYFMDGPLSSIWVSHLRSGCPWYPCFTSRCDSLHSSHALEKSACAEGNESVIFSNW